MSPAVWVYVHSCICATSLTDLNFLNHSWGSTKQPSSMAPQRQRTPRSSVSWIGSNNPERYDSSSCGCICSLFKTRWGQNEPTEQIFLCSSLFFYFLFPVCLCPCLQIETSVFRHSCGHTLVTKTKRTKITLFINNILKEPGNYYSVIDALYICKRESAFNSMNNPVVCAFGSVSVSSQVGWECFLEVCVRVCVRKLTCFIRLQVTIQQTAWIDNVTYCRMLLSAIIWVHECHRCQTCYIVSLTVI